MAKTGAKGRKIGRNSKKCEKYRAGNKREKNKKRRAAKRALTYAKNAAKRNKLAT